MADEPRWDEIFSSQPSGERPPAVPPTPGRGTSPVPQSRRELREAANTASRNRSDGRAARRGPKPPGRRRRRWIGWLVSIVVLIGLAAGAAWYVWTNYEEQVRKVMGWELPIDYVGEGTDAVVVTITNGQIGSDVARTLHKAGVTMTVEAFYNLLLTKPDVQFHPGSYSLKKQMSAQAALDALLDPANHVQTRAAIPEGTTVKGVIARLGDLSESTGVTVEQLQAAAADYTSYGLPAQAPSLEGYLFPATYSLDPGMSAHDILQRMVDEMFTRLDAAGVAPADRHRVLTLAALTQKEGGSSSDFYKVARVWDNRIEQGMNLQSDATVSYGSGGTTISTTDAERADKSNPYNTYANPGLPIGPISNPGEAAIDATLHPADGPWLYFVLINGETGETAFSTTLAEHNAAVKVWQKWLREHPGFDD